MGETLRLDRDGKIARLVIDRPETKNGFNRAMWAALPGLLDQAIASGAQVVIVQSAVDGVFSAGADLKEFQAFLHDKPAARANELAIRTAGRALAGCPLPVVAAIDGACMGGGYLLANCADIRLASDRSNFGFPPAKLGLLYHFEGLARLVATIGDARVRELMMTGRVLSAQEALAYGLVHEVVEHAEYHTRLAALVDGIAALSPFSHRMHKDWLDKIAAGQRQMSDETETAFTDMHAGPDHREGLTAFLEKRKPRF